MKKLRSTSAAIVGLAGFLAGAAALPAADIPALPVSVTPGTTLSNAAVVAATAATTAAGTNGSTGVSAATTIVATPPGVAPGTTVAATSEQPLAAGETTIQLDVGSGLRAVPAARMSVPNNEKLRIVAPFVSATAGATNAQGGISGSTAATGTYIWFKDGKVLTTTATGSLTIDRVQSADSGTYTCAYSTPTSLPVPSQALVLAVGPVSRLQNVSVRGVLAAGPGQNFVTGFVVAAGAQPKKMVIRAVGPGLAQFGVPNTLARPVLRIFDGSGAPYTNGYVYAAVVGGLTYETDLADSLARVGAFPTPAGSADAVLLLPFTAGAYTAQVTSADGRGGDVLVEIYEVP